MTLKVGFCLFILGFTSLIKASGNASCPTEMARLASHTFEFMPFDLAAKVPSTPEADMSLAKLLHLLAVTTGDARAIELKQQFDRLPPILQRSFLEASLNYYDPPNIQTTAAAISGGAKIRFKRIPRDTAELSTIRKLDELLGRYQQAYQDLLAPVSVEHPWARINATETEVVNFNSSFVSSKTGTQKFQFLGKKFEVANAVLEKMRTWAKSFSHGLTTETKGHFRYRVQGDDLVIEDFFPSPSTSISIAASERLANETQNSMLGILGRTDWAGKENYWLLIQKVRELPPIEKARGGYLPFHSHFSTSGYQARPSLPDLSETRDEISVLWAPNPTDPSGLGNLIFYNQNQWQIIPIR